MASSSLNMLRELTRKLQSSLWKLVADAGEKIPNGQTKRKTIGNAKNNYVRISEWDL